MVTVISWQIYGSFVPAAVTQQLKQNNSSRITTKESRHTKSLDSISFAAPKLNRILLRACNAIHHHAGKQNDN
jgi:hypothetical protein